MIFPYGKITFSVRKNHFFRTEKFKIEYFRTEKINFSVRKNYVFRTEQKTFIIRRTVTVFPNVSKEKLHLLSDLSISTGII